MSIIGFPSGKSLNSYSKDEWEILLKETAYRGLKIHKISKRLKKAQGCTFEDEHLINLITSKGKTITVDMNKVLKKQDQWVLSRLVHNIRMLFPNSNYAIKFNDRIAKLAETLFRSSLPQDFHNRCQANMGNFTTLPTDIHDQIIYAMPLRNNAEADKCMNLMKMFWKAPLGGKTVHDTIDVQKFAQWLNKNLFSAFSFELGDSDLRALLPYLETLAINSDQCHLSQLVVNCKNLNALTLNDCSDFVKKHFQLIARLQNLTFLSIRDYRNFSGKEFKLITGLTKLTQLQIEHCPLTREGFKHLASLSSLIKIYFSFQNFKDEDFEQIGKLSNLRFLFIWNSLMTKTGESYIKELSNLDNLWVNKCQYFSESHDQDDYPQRKLIPDFDLFRTNGVITQCL